MIKRFASYRSLGWQLWSLRICRTSVFWLLLFPLRFQVLVYQVSDIFYMVFFPLKLSIFFILHVQCFDYYMPRGLFLWSSVFSAFYSSPTLIGTLFSRFGKLSSIILLKMFSVLFDPGFFSFFHSCYSYIWSFYSVLDFLDVQCLKFLDLTFLTNVFISSIMASLRFSLPFIVFVWLGLPMNFMFKLLNFHFPYFTNFEEFFLFYNPLSILEVFY